MRLTIPKIFKFLAITVLFLPKPSRVSSTEPKELDRFWTNTGFAPIGSDSRDIFLSSDTLTNIDLISSLPNKALETIRIHWILDLIDTGAHQDSKKYERLDKFLDALVLSAELNLGLEFMSHDAHFNWTNDSYEILHRYTKRYGIEVTSKWKLETWNEPDLKAYNVLNFTIDGQSLSFPFFLKFPETFLSILFRLPSIHSGPSKRDQKSM